MALVFDVKHKFSQVNYSIRNSVARNYNILTKNITKDCKKDNQKQKLCQNQEMLQCSK